MAEPYYGNSGGNNQNRPGGQGYHYDYGYGGGSSGQPHPPQNPKNDRGWGDWIGMGVLFLIPSFITKLIAVIWFFRKVSAMSRAQKDAYRQDARRAANQVKDAFVDMGGDFAQEFRSARDKAARFGQTKSAQNARSAQRQNDNWNVRSRWDQAQSRAKKEADGSIGLMIGGGVLTGIFGLGTVSILFDILESWYWGYFSWGELVGMLGAGVFMAGGIAMLAAGIGTRRRAERYINYLGYIGANREVPLAHMAATFGVPVARLCKDLRRMLAKGILPAGYLDLAEGKLFLTEMGYRQPVREEPRQETAQEAEAREDDILRQIRQVNDQIPDAVMSAKIDRIEEITGKILAYQKAHPNREAQLRSFLNYYLPTTLKILRAYAQLDAQGVEGENISAAKERIEGMMDQVVAGFEKQLDKLFRDDAMDITSDVEVLENMLKKDGLSGDGMGMTL